MRCVTIDGTGQVIDVVPQPSDLTGCALVLATPGELNADLFTLSLEDAGLISLAIISLWAFAAAIRLIVRFVWGWS